jgi:hypothetical protein
MAKQEFNISYTILHIFTYHPWLKLISFVLAVIVWLYIKEEIFITS